MSNSLSSVVKSRYTKTVQALLEQSLVALALANTRLVSDMPDGNTVNFPRTEYTGVAQYVKYTDVTDEDLVSSNETLTIDKHPYVSFNIDLEDEQDIGYDVISNETKKNAYLLKEEIDGDFFNQYQYASYENSSAVALVAGSSQNVTSTYGNAYAEIANNGTDMSKVALVVDPFQLNLIGQAALGNSFNVADSFYKNGYAGNFLGMKVFVSGNLTCIGILALGEDVTADDTVTTNGIEWKLVASLTTPAVAGEVLAGANAAASRDNLVAAINGAAGAGTTYSDITAANRNNKLRGLTAVETGTTIVLTSKRGYKPCSSNLTHASNLWGAFTIHNLIMKQGSVDLVMRNGVMMKEESIQKQLGRRFIVHTRYGLKTFTEGADGMYDVKIVAQSAETS